MSFAPLLLTVALQGVSVAPNPPDCAVFAGFLHDYAARQAEEAVEDRIIVRYPLGFSSLLPNSQESALNRISGSQLNSFVGVLPAQEALDLSRRVLAARQGEIERLYAEGVGGNELLDRVNDYIEREFPYRPEEINPDPSTRANLSDNPTARIECEFGGSIPANTVFTEISDIDGPWVEIGTDQRLTGDDAWIFHALSVLAVSDDRSEAILYGDAYCGELCGGGGTFYLMRRNDTDAWNVVGFLGDWIT